MAQVVFIYVTSGTRIWQRWYYSMAINSFLALKYFSLNFSKLISKLGSENKLLFPTANFFKVLAAINLKSKFGRGCIALISFSSTITDNHALNLDISTAIG